MKTTIILCATILTSAAMVGCSREVTSSANVKTAGIAALIDVTAEDDENSTVHVDLKVGGSSSNAYVILENNDRLTANSTDPDTGAAGEDKVLQAQSEGEYEAEFKIAKAGTVFTVKLERGDTTDVDALENKGILPAPFSITKVPTAALSRANDPITIEWSPAAPGTFMEMKLDGTCIFSKTFDVVGDEGTHTIAAGDLDSTGGDMPTDCNVSVEMRRWQNGEADKAFDKESWFKLHQVRKASFPSKP